MPTTLPDLLKTPEVIDFEFEAQGRSVRDTQIDQGAARLAYVRRPETDIEACCSIQSVEAFARGHDLWQRLPRDIRLAQMGHMIGSSPMATGPKPASLCHSRHFGSRTWC